MRASYAYTVRVVLFHLILVVVCLIVARKARCQKHALLLCLRFNILLLVLQYCLQVMQALHILKMLMFAVENRLQWGGYELKSALPKARAFIMPVIYI